MGSISLPTMAIIAAASSAVGTGVAAYSSHEQGVATANADKQKARAAALQATQQQINSRQKMLAALASQNAGTLGAVGTGTGSSFGANALRQITQNQNDLMVSKSNESSQVSLLDAAAANAVATGNIAAAGDVVQGIGSNFTGGANSNAASIGKI